MQEEASRQSELEFRGDSLEILSDFPDDVKRSLGYNLRRLQKGLPAQCEWRPMASVGKGVVELKESDERTWYRLIYLARIDDVIYVLHCFEKDSAKISSRDLTIAVPDCPM